MTTAITEKTIPFVSPCPSGCSNRMVIDHWIRQGCGHQIFLKGNGNLLCRNNCIEASICEWRFACGIHQGDYRPVEFHSLIDALGCAIRSTKAAFFKDDREAVLFLRTVQDNIVEKLIK